MALGPQLPVKTAWTPLEITKEAVWIPAPPVRFMLSLAKLSQAMVSVSTIKRNSHLPNLGLISASRSRPYALIATFINTP
jgi:hypothetical protein